MVWFKENKFNILVNYVNIIFLVTVMKVCYEIQKFDYLLITFIFFITVVVCFFYSRVLKSLTYKLLFSSVVICILSVLIYLKKDYFFYYISKNFVGNFNDINDLLYKDLPTEFTLFKHYFIVILPIIVVILYILYYKGLTESVLVLNLVIMLLFWYLEYVAEIKSVLFAFIALSAATYSLNNHMKYLKKVTKLGVKTYINSKSVFMNMIIYSVMVAVIGMMLPQSYQGNYTQETMAKWINPFSPDAKATIGKAKEGRFGLSSSGYSNSERELGGPLNLSDELALQVKSDMPLYLRGDVKDVYTGNAWIKDEENYQSKSDVSDSSTNRFLENNIKYGLQSNKMNITIIPKGINTNTMFVPYYTSKVFIDKGNVYFEANGETFINSAKVTKEYNIEVYDPQMVADYINRYFTYRDIKVQRNRNDKYLEYPKEISVRTVELVYEIVKNSKTNKGKVEAIQNYLSQAYPYSLDVSTVPENEEFLDYFLFTEKKGYCTYFATAMTIMCRIAGIPARYVEGYKMPAQSVNGIFDVTNEQAHAWTEVLYQEEPQLWVVKDPSPTPQEVRERVEQQQETEVSAVPTTTPAAELDTPEDEAEKLIEDNRDFGNIDSLKSVNYKIIVVVSVFVIILIYITVRMLLYGHRRKIIIMHKSNIPLYNYCLKRLKAAGIKKEDTETDRDFSKKIENKELSSYMSELVERVYEEFYGGNKSVDFDKLKMYKDLEEYIKLNQNTFIYILKKYFI